MVIKGLRINDQRYEFWEFYLKILNPTKQVKVRFDQAMVSPADFAFKVPAELEAALRLNSVHHYVTKRPWLGKFLCFLF